MMKYSEKQKRRACLESWRHWDQIARMESPDRAFIGMNSCELCALYNGHRTWHVHLEDSCLSCPVYEKSGRVGCKGTPYDEFAEWWSRLVPKNAEEGRRLARAEADFLLQFVSKRWLVVSASGGAEQWLLDAPGSSAAFPSREKALEWAEREGYLVTGGEDV
jgi:hypothetical protein